MSLVTRSALEVRSSAQEVELTSNGPDVTTVATYHQGTHRAVTPEQTRENIRPLLPVVGITRVADVTWLDDLGIATVQAVRPDSLLLSVSQGKGATEAAAWVSAVMESVEMWHAEHIGDDAHTGQLGTGTARELGSELTYDPETLTLAAGSVYHRDQRMRWLPATTLRGHLATWVPLDLVCLDATASCDYRPPTFVASTNGLASGNLVEEATLHALYEVLERDCLARADDLPRLELDLGSVDDPLCRELIDRIRDVNDHLTVYDVSVDHLPCYAAQLRRPGAAVVHHGSGLHHDPAVALARAVTEAAQSRITDIAGAREDVEPLVHQAFLRTVGDEPRARETATLVALGRGPGTDSPFQAQVAEAATAARRRFGQEPVVVTLDLGLEAPIAVVKVVCPGAAYTPDAMPHRRAPGGGS